MCGLNYNPEPPNEPEINLHDECEIGRLEREIEQYEAQINALEGKSDDEFTDEDSDQVYQLDLWIGGIQSEIRNIYDRYGIAA